METLALALDVFHKILCFPFGLSYYEYTIDISSDDISIVLYPDLYFSTMEDRDLLRILVQLFEGQINKEISLNLLYVFGRMVACRLSLFNTDEDRNKHKNEYCLLFPVLVNHSPLEDRKFLNEVIDYGLKAFYVFSVRFISQNAGLLKQWTDAWRAIGFQAIAGSDSFVDPVLTRYFDYLKKWQEHDSAKARDLVIEFFQHYAAHFFKNPPENFFPDQFITAKKFTKSVEKRLGVLKELYSYNYLPIGKILEQIGGQLLDEEMQLRNGLNANVFAIKFAHYILAITSWMLTSDHRSSYYSDEFSDNAAKPNCLVIIFAIMTRASQFEAALSPRVRRVLELSILYLFEKVVTYFKNNIRVNADGASANVQDDAWAAICAAKICSSFEEFFDMATNKILSNFMLGDLLVSRYSIQVLKVVIDKTKRVTEELKESNLHLFLSEKLFGVADAFLSDKKALKTRSELLQAIASIHFDDYS